MMTYEELRDEYIWNLEDRAINCILGSFMTLMVFILCFSLPGLLKIVFLIPLAILIGLIFAVVLCFREYKEETGERMWK